MKLYPLDAGYPPSLCHLDEPPVLTLSGPLDGARRAVAIVGSRSASKEACAFTHALAYHLAKADLVVVSGGAKGIDSMAHEGALAAGGSTWCVACTGRGEAFPTSNRALFAGLEQSSSSRMIWPLPDGTVKDEHTPRYRNGVLVGLAECVIVVQAGPRSGSLNAITWARRLGRRLFLVPGMPWDVAFEGTVTEGARGGAEVLWSLEQLFLALALPPPDMSDPGAAWGGITPRARPVRPYRSRRQSYSDAPLFEVDPSAWSEDEKIVFSSLSMAPIQQDSIVEQVGLPTSTTLTALLTLSLKDVVVEGPDGFFRRRIAL
ncbi:MAG: DNA-processing protein DprA [Labilithrix sp.]|nr:DNA-processing protein DprA [Labilithrix sp.]